MSEATWGIFISLSIHIKSNSDQELFPDTYCGGWRRSLGQALAFHLAMDIRLTDVTQRLKNKQNLRECLPLWSREYGEHHFAWGPFKCAIEILEGRYQHHGDVRCPSPLTPFKQLISHPSMNKSASIGAVGSSTVHQGTGDQSCSPVHSFINRQADLEPVGASKPGPTPPDWSWGNLESGDFSRNLRMRFCRSLAF